MNDTNEIQNFIHRKWIELEGELIRKVLTEFLNAEPTIEDFKKTTKFLPEGIVDFYYLAYNNLKLGKVMLNFGAKEGKIGIDFIPFDNDQFLEQATKDNKVTFKTYHIK